MQLDNIITPNELDGIRQLCEILDGENLTNVLKQLRMNQFDNDNNALIYREIRKAYKKRFGSVPANF